MKFKISDFTAVDKPHKLPYQVIDYGVRMIGAPLEWPETEGEGIRVGIIDTGIDLTHEDLQGRVVDYYDFISNTKSGFHDDNGHGTHVAGIIAANNNNIGVVGVAPKASLFIAKAFNKDGNGESKDVVKAMQWLMSKNVHVINMSFNTREYVSEYAYLIKKCYAQGIVTVCSAGNEGNGPDTIEYPAKFPETISVTAVDMNKRITDFSSTGARADIAAPGKDILSTYPGSTYVTLSGTSMAAPLITGSVALLQDKSIKRMGRLLTPAEIKLVLDMYADDLGEKGKDNKYGYGLFSFGRLNSNEIIRTDYNSFQGGNMPPHQTLNHYAGIFPPPPHFNINPYWRIFNNTLLLKFMGLSI